MNLNNARNVLPEIPDGWLPTLVNAVFCRVSVNNAAVPCKNTT